MKNYRGILLLSTALTAAALPAGAQPAPNARPTGGQVVAGTARISQTATTTVIEQSSNRAAVNWASFDVGSQQSVNFQQPSAASVTLNRVTGPDPSAIAGQIHANGQVILTNPSGVVFYKGAQVNAQSLVVSAPGITTQNFMAGRMIFDQVAHPNASVTNAGTITVRETGLAALVAPRVANSGVINARLGHAVLAGAEAATLDMYGDGLVAVDVTKQVTTSPGGKQALVTNTGTIIADGGQVLLTAAAVDGVVSKLVDAGGHVRANSIGSKTGTIAINGTGGGIVLSGSIAAMGNLAGTSGGAIEVNSDKSVRVGKRAVVDASGRAGGGTIALGTTLARTVGGPTVTPTMTAARTKIAGGAQIHADAKQSGNGGKVTVLSTQSTAMHGTITATGGSSGGNGGLIEVSSDGVVALDGMINVGAPAGKLGEILLDPGTLDIVTSSTLAISPNPTAPNVSFAQDGTVGVSYLSAALLGSLTGSIQLFAATDINVLGAINLGSIGQGLYLGAGRNINVAAPITTNGTIVVVASSTRSPLTTTIGGVAISAAVTSNNNNIYLQSQGGGITLGANVNAGTAGLSAVAAGGTFAQTGGVITAGTLTGRATYGVSLGQPNLIGTIGTPGTGFTVTKSGNFSLTEAPGTTLFLSSKVAVQSGQTISLQTDALGVNIASPGGGVTTALNGSVYAPSGSVAIAPVTANRPILLTAQTTGSYAGAGSVASTLLLNGQVLKYIAGSKLTIGSTAAGPVTIGTAADTSIAVGRATPTLAPATLSLISGSSISQNAALTVGTLSATGTGITLSNSGNAVSSWGSFTASTYGIALTDRYDINLIGNVSAPAGHVTLTTTGNITQSSSVSLITPLLEASSRYTISLLGTNTIGTLGNISSIGGESTELTTINNTGLLTIGGSISSGNYIGISSSGAIAMNSSATLTAGNAIFLASGDSISQTDGAALITAGTLSGSATSVALTSTNNSIGNLGSFAVSGSGGFALTNTEAMLIVGTVSVPSGAQITLNDSSSTFLPGASYLLSAPGGIVQLAPGTTGADFALDGIGSIRAGTLAIGNSTAGAISISGSIALPSGTIDLVSASSVSETSVGSLTASTLIGSAASATLTGSNSITSLGSFATTGGFAFTNTSGLAVTGLVSASSVGLTVPGTLLGAGGAISTSTLTGTASYVALTGANTIASLGSFTASSGLVLNDSGALLISGPVAGSSFATISTTGALAIGGTLTATSLDLLAGGAISEPTGGRLVATTLTGSAASAALIQSGNAIGTLSGFIAGAGFTLTDGIALTIAGSNVAGTGATLEIDDDTPSFVSGTSLSAPGGSVILAPGTIGDGFTLSDIPTGVVTAGTLVLGASTAGAVEIDGSISLPGGVIELLSSADVSESGGLSAATLTGKVGSASLVGGLSNVINNLGSFTSSTGFDLFTNSSSLTVTGPVNDSRSIAIGVSGSLNISGTLAAPSVSFLVPSGAINETSGGVLVATTLTGSAASAAFIQAGNSVGTLSAFKSTGGGFTLTDGIALTIAGSNNVVSLDRLVINDDAPTFVTGASLNAPGGTVVLAPAGSDGFTLAGIGSITAGTLAIGSSSAGAVTIAGGVYLPSAVVDLLSSSSVSEIGSGGLTAATLIGNVASASLTGSNTITNLGSFTSTSGLTLNDSGALLVSGPVSDRSFATIFSTGALSIGGSLSAPAIDLLSGGALIETSGGALLGTTLSGTATSAQLSKAANAIGTLTGFTTSIGGFTLVDSLPLTLSGANTVAPTTTLAISDDNLTFRSGSTLIASGGTVALAPAAVTDALTVSGTGIVSAGTLLIASGAAVSIAGNLTVPSGVIDLSSLAGSIGETSAGGLSAATLVGSASSASLNGRNTIANLGLFKTTRGFALTDQSALSVTGPVTDGRAIALTTSAGALTLAGVIDAPTVALNAGGAITQTGGTLTASALLTGSAGSAVQLGTAGTAVISNLGSFSVASAALTLNSSSDMTLSGPITANSVNITAPNNLTLFGGTLTIGADSTIAVGGDPSINQTDTTTIAGAGTLTFALSAGSGSIGFADLEAPGITVNLSLGSGSATGVVNAQGLNLVSAIGGTASLTGTIAGVSSVAAAQTVTIASGSQPAYTFNACIIASVTCTTPPITTLPVTTPPVTPIPIPNMPPVTPIPVTATPVPPPPQAPSAGVTPPNEPNIIGVVEKSAAAEARSTVQLPFLNGFLSFIFSQDLDDPDLVLPNISDRDY